MSLTAVFAKVLCAIKNTTSTLLNRMKKPRVPKIFFFKHKESKQQQHEYDRLTVALKHLPESLSAFKIPCPSCGIQYQPDWFKKHEVPMTPVKPKYETKGVGYTGPARWILKQVSQKCPNCNADIAIELPVNKTKARGSLFGDDAKRECENKAVFVYSLIGVDQSLLPEIERNIQNIKQKLIPALNPKSWKIHLKDMWSGSNRKRHPIYQSLTFEDLQVFVTKLMKLIKDAKPFVYNMAATMGLSQGSNKKDQEQLRNESYILLVMNVIDEWTEKNAQPTIYFDSEKDSKANLTIHGWARDTFTGSQFSLLYGFLSKGIEIPEPKFVPPGSFPCLELADFVSFTIARYYYRMWQGKAVEIDPSELGLVTYLGYDNKGDLLWKRQVGYPWDEIKH